MVKTATQLQDIDTSLETRLPAIVQLSKVAAPYTTVQNRAQVTNFAADLLPRFGVDRVTIQAIQEVQGEYGPNGERVFKPVNDVHDAVRFVGGSWGSFNDANGQYSQHPSASTSDYLEITFYGTGLNVLVGFNTTANRSLSVVVDGGGSSSVAFTGATGSSVLNSRNYSLNMVFNIVSGLSLGLHTVKITGNGTSAQLYNGYEVLNTTSTLQQVPGSSYVGGQRRYASALTTSSPTSGFTNTYGTAGTRGGHVLVYQKPDGTIAKDIRYTETAAAYLASANHTNEEVTRVYHWREFGAGRTDDFSSLVTGAASNRAFTLDDGTTTLVGFGVHTRSDTPEALAVVNNADFWTITFVGTGLDIARQDSAVGGADTYTMTIDGTSIGTLSSTGSTSRRIEKICSGLPYGTHTVKMTRTSASTFIACVHQFIVYGPKVPALPSGCVAIGDYFVMADYINDAASPPTALTVSQGILRKMPLREMIYSGTWTVDAIAPSVSSGGFQTYTTVATTDYIEYTFVGTGFNFRTQGTGGGALSWTVSLNGPANTNWTAYTSSISAGGTATWNNATGVLSVPTSAPKATLFVSGLPFGKQTVRLTKTSGAFASYVDAFDVITPIHAPKLNGPFVVQNTLAVGSCAVRDLRSFGENQIAEYKNSSQAIGVNGSVTTTSTTAIPVPDMSVIIKTSGKPIQIDYRITANHGTAAGGFLGYIYVNGVQVGTSNVVNGPNSGYDFCVSDSFKVPVAAGYHKVDIYYNTAAGTLSLSGTRRNLTVQEI